MIVGTVLAAVWWFIVWKAWQEVGPDVKEVWRGWRNR